MSTTPGANGPMRGTAFVDLGDVLVAPNGDYSAILVNGRLCALSTLSGEPVFGLPRNANAGCLVIQPVTSHLRPVERGYDKDNWPVVFERWDDGALSVRVRWLLPTAPGGSQPLVLALIEVEEGAGQLLISAQPAVDNRRPRGTWTATTFRVPTATLSLTESVELAFTTDLARFDLAGDWAAAGRRVVAGERLMVAFAFGPFALPASRLVAQEMFDETMRRSRLRLSSGTFGTALSVHERDTARLIWAFQARSGAILPGGPATLLSGERARETVTYHGVLGAMGLVTAGFLDPDFSEFVAGHMARHSGRLQPTYRYTVEADRPDGDGTASRRRPSSAAAWMLRYYLTRVEAHAGLTEMDKVVIEQLVAQVQEWRLPDAGLWGAPGEPRHHVGSKLMSSVGLDSAAALYEHLGRSAEAELLRAEAERVIEDVRQHGFDAHGCLKRAYAHKGDGGAEHCDASVVLAAVLGVRLTAAELRRSVEAVRTNLLDRGFVFAHNAPGAPDGVYGHEGASLLATIWLAHAFANLGETPTARELLVTVQRSGGTAGLLSTAIDTETRRPIGRPASPAVHAANLLAWAAVVDVEDYGVVIAA